MEPEEGFEPSTFRLRVETQSSSRCDPGLFLLLMSAGSSVECGPDLRRYSGWNAEGMTSPATAGQPAVLRPSDLVSEGDSKPTTHQDPRLLASLPPARSQAGGRPDAIEVPARRAVRLWSQPLSTATVEVLMECDQVEHPAPEGVPS